MHNNSLFSAVEYIFADAEYVFTDGELVFSVEKYKIIGEQTNFSH